MPRRKERRRVAMECNGCGREFLGMATYAVHTVAEQGAPVQTTLDRIETGCPHCGSHDVRPQAG